MGERGCGGGADGSGGAVPGRARRLTTVVARGAAVGLLVAGGLLLGAELPDPGPALAADPVPAPAPVPYGGALDAPDPGGSFADEQVLEVAMLGLGAVNGLAFAGVVIVSRLRGSSASATRRALMARTGRGVPSGPRPRDLH